LFNSFDSGAGRFTEGHTPALSMHLRNALTYKVLRLLTSAFVKISLHLFSAESATSGIENPSSHFS
jgi:hypothetical protein